jgi:MFS family permease
MAVDGHDELTAAEVGTEVHMHGKESSAVPAAAADGGQDKTREIVQRVLSLNEGSIVNLQQARDATAIEHTLSIKQALRVYSPAIVWTILFSLGNVMVGFDPQLTGTLIAIPEFQKQYGHMYDGAYTVKAQWQSAFNLSAPLGAIIGSYAFAYPLDRWGRRLTLGMCSVGSMVSVALQVSGQSKEQLLIAEILNGLFIGGYSVVVPTYISEITPVVLRGVATASINIFQVAGQLICSGVLAGTQNRPDRWSYGIPFACQWFFPVAIFIGVFFAPESPWWLARQGKTERARHELDRLTTNDIDTDTLLANIVLTTQLEAMQHSEVRFMDMFRGSNRRRTIISTMAFCTQVFSGTAFVIGYCVYFFELAGLGRVGRRVPGQLSFVAARREVRKTSDLSLWSDDTVVRFTADWHSGCVASLRHELRYQMGSKRHSVVVELCL